MLWLGVGCSVLAPPSLALLVLVHWDGVVVVPGECTWGLESVGGWVVMHGIVWGWSFIVGQRRGAGTETACSVECISDMGDSNELVYCGKGLVLWGLEHLLAIGD